MSPADYMIVTATSTGGLEKKVEDAMARGWSPLGGPVFLPPGQGSFPFMFMQAVTRPRPAKEPAP
jgi:hypothetical protein